jgi:Transposase
VLFVGNDWAEDHHDVELVDEQGRVLVRRRLPEGIVGMAGLHELIADHLPEDAEPGRVVIGIETDRGPWVAALVAAGYRVYPINPMQVLQPYFVINHCLDRACTGALGYIGYRK